MNQLALFPLKTVLLPGNGLSLKIFEPRYSDMIAHCMREDTAFGVVLIYHGEETASNNKIFSIGTSARVIDWQNRDDGLLGITVLGQQRFQIHSTHHADNGLLIADIEYLPETVVEQIPDQFYYMTELLRHILANKTDEVTELDFNATVYQLIYLLPLDNALKQQLLEVPGPHDRAVALHAELIRLGVIQYVKP
jgi:Lon protease-like protein